MPVTLTVPTTKIKSRVIIRRASATPLTVHTPVVVIHRDVQQWQQLLFGRCLTEVTHQIVSLEGGQ